MISYELAKSLKDAGFPQEQYKAGFYLTPDTPEGFSIMDMETLELASDVVYIPTLSELIEACGDRFVSLRKFDIDWGVKYKINGENKGLVTTSPLPIPRTPEEAVAILWLKLNKNENTKNT